MDFKSLYIHIPFCLSKCTYCDFFSIPQKSISENYVDALCNEIKFRLCGLENGFERSEKLSSLETVYIGGGTPSLLSLSQIKKITGTIYDTIGKKGSGKIKEFTVEVNPDDVTKELLEVLSVCGVTRLSCGIQSFNDKSLSFCHRRADRKTNLHAIELFQNYWDGELSLDLISALPYETCESFLEGLGIVTETKANHISLYSLTIEEETPLGKIFENGEIDYDFDKADSMWLSGRDFLKSKGFVQYEVSNFCKHDKKSIHNLSYWNHESYIGCGSGATGTKYKSDASAYRWTNTRDIKKYIDFWNNEKIDREKIPEECEKIERDTSKFEFFMMGLRTLDGIKKSRFEKIFGETFSSDTEMLFQKWKREGKAVINGDIYALNEKGILYLNDFLSSI